jgi:hypothetical protein
MRPLALAKRLAACLALDIQADEPAPGLDLITFLYIAAV